MLRTTAILALVAAASAAQPPTPPPSKQLKRYTIDLDKAPEDRWTEVVTDHKEYIHIILKVLKGLFLSKANKNTSMAFVNNAKFSDEIRREMQGVADTLGVSYEDAVLANMFYEISQFASMLPKEWAGVGGRSCTSIVAQHPNGTVFHARNQDYPPPFSPLQFDGTFVKGGKVLFEGTTFAGTVGVGGTCVHPGGFSISIDARDANRLPLDQAVKAAQAGGHVFPILTRLACQRGGDFESAVEYISNETMISPGYFIMAGAKTGEGAVVTHNASIGKPAVNDIWRLGNGYPKKAPWYLVETNYDHWAPAPLPDYRRYAAMLSMDEMGAENISFDNLWKVLSKFPVFNPLTIHTDFVIPATGLYRTYERHNIV